MLNLEPNYEAALGYAHRTRFDAASVRRAAYWSLLIAPTAGVTFGHDSIWNWNDEAGPSVGHGNWGGGRVEPWQAGLATPGVAAMSTLRRILDALPWWTLRPYQELLVRQPAPEDPRQRVVAARSIEVRFALVYTPAANALELRGEPWSAARWIDPSDGSSHEAEPSASMLPPGPGDWLLLLHDGSLAAPRASSELGGFREGYGSTQ